MPEQQTHLLAERYELVAPLGRGTMGTVWRARDRALGREVAVKEIRQDTGLTEEQRAELRERMVREGRIASRINHPAVAAIHDVIVHGNRPWIIMELVEGRSLEQVIDEEGPLPPRLVAEIGVDLLGALRAAHSQGITHRDVKPGNVLITENGRVVLTDFGIAKAEGDPKLTKTGMVIGSPGYTAPERARGEYTGPESDIWSLGATLYFAVEGRPAYERSTIAETLAALLSESADPPTQAGPLRPVLEGLLNKDHKRRMTAAQAETMLRMLADTPTSDIPAITPDTDRGPYPPGTIPPGGGHPGGGHPGGGQARGGQAGGSHPGGGHLGGGHTGDMPSGPNPVPAGTHGPGQFGAGPAPGGGPFGAGPGGPASGSPSGPSPVPTGPQGPGPFGAGPAPGSDHPHPHAPPPAEVNPYGGTGPYSGKGSPSGPNPPGGPTSSGGVDPYSPSAPSGGTGPRSGPTSSGGVDPYSRPTPSGGTDPQGRPTPFGGSNPYGEGRDAFSSPGAQQQAGQADTERTVSMMRPKTPLPQNPQGPQSDEGTFATTRVPRNPQLDPPGLQVYPPTQQPPGQGQQPAGQQRPPFPPGPPPEANDAPGLGTDLFSIIGPEKQQASNRTGMLVLMAVAAAAAVVIAILIVALLTN